MGPSGGEVLHLGLVLVFEHHLAAVQVGGGEQVAGPVAQHVARIHLGQRPEEWQAFRRSTDKAVVVEVNVEVIDATPVTGIERWWQRVVSLAA